MSDEKIINYANGINKLPPSSLNEYKKFLKTNKIRPDLKDLIKVQKPLSDKEVLIKNKLKEQINNLSLEYNIPSELICTSKNLVNFIRGEDLGTINKGWRSKIFKL